MRKGLVFATGAAVLVVALAAVFMFNNVTTVSARTILDRAARAQNEELPTQGILHIRFERFFNYEALPQDQVPSTIEDTYYDLGTCKTRKVNINSKTGVVGDVHSTDGTYVYGGFNYDINASGPLSVYRSPNDPSKVSCESPSWWWMADKDSFDQMLADPSVEFVGEETWEDGHKVYVLRSEIQSAKLAPDAAPIPVQMYVYFDADTYKSLGGKEFITGDDGKQLLISEKLYTLDEILPADSPIKWDLSDVQGINIIDDPDGSHLDTGARG